METGSGKKILIVEDETDVVDLLALNLRKAGFRISSAADGASGLEKTRADKPDFVILDLMLPKMPGLEVCKILKSDPVTRAIPILMLTAKAEEIDRIVGLEFGADDYVVKPFSPREVVLRIQAILRRGEAVDESFKAGPISVDPARHQVHVSGRTACAATPRETRQSRRHDRDRARLRLSFARTIGRMFWIVLGASFVVLVLLAYTLWAKWGAPWREMDKIVRQGGRGEQPRTF